MIPLRPAKPNVLVVHPRMRVNHLIHGKPREWDVEMLDNQVVPFFRVWLSANLIEMVSFFEVTKKMDTIQYNWVTG